MRGLSTGPPRLALPLLLLAILSTVTAVLHVVVEPTFESLDSLPFIPAMTAVYSGDYLVRYLRRRAEVKREMLAGGDAWPVAQLFPGPREHPLHPQLALLSLLYNILSFQDMPKDVVNMRWLTNISTIALIASYVMGLVANGVVLIQARHVVRAEDNVRCAEAHAMQCSRCSALPGQLVTLPTQPTLHPTQPALHPTHVLIPTIALTAALLYTMQAPLNAYGPRVFTAWAALPAFALLYHIYLLLRIQTAARRQAAAWPAVSIVPVKVMVYLAGHIVLCWIYLVGAIVVLKLAAGEVREAPMPVLCLGALVLVHFAGAAAGLQMAKVQVRARCEREGHAWKCTRWCSVPQVQAASGQAALADSKMASEKVCLPADHRRMCMLMNSIGPRSSLSKLIPLFERSMLRLSCVLVAVMSSFSTFLHARPSS
jgi:hypothetical protein